MHDAAFDFVADAVEKYGPFARTVEFGSADINGGIRSLFGEYLGIDVVEAPGVDLVTDAAAWTSGDPFDCVVCCEVFEHTPDWQLLIASAHRNLKSGGVLVVTAAGPGRGPHSAFDGNALRDGEHYGNIDPDDLAEALSDFKEVRVEQLGLDVRATAVKP